MNCKIDPTTITSFNRTGEELELLMLFCVSVAGKTAKQISAALEKFLTDPEIYRYTEQYSTGHGNIEFEDCYGDMNMSPFEKVRFLHEKGTLHLGILNARLGQYTKLTHAFYEVASRGFDLRTVTVEQLESIKGIGPKTSRFFILHSRKTKDIACLDTHVLKWLAKKNGHDVPKNPPSGKTYKKLEKAFIEHANVLGIPTYDLDLQIWNESSVRSGKK